MRETSYRMSDDFVYSRELFLMQNKSSMLWFLVLGHGTSSNFNTLYAVQNLFPKCA